MVKNEVRAEYFRNKYEAELNAASQNSKASTDSQSLDQDFCKLLDDAQIKLRAELEALQSQLLGQEEALLQATEILRSESEMYKSHLADETQVRTNLEDTVLQYEAELQGTRTKLQDALNELVKERDALAKLRADYAVKDQQCEDRSGKIKQCDVQLHEVEADLEKTRRQLAAVMEDLAASKREADGFETEARRERSEVAKLRSDYAVQDQLCKDRLLRIENDEEHLRELEAELEKTRRQLSAVTEDLAASKREADRMELTAEHKISDAEAKVQRKSSELIEESRIHDKLEVELAAKQSECKELLDLSDQQLSKIRHLEGQNKRSQLDLQDAQNSEQKLLDRKQELELELQRQSNESVEQRRKLDKKAGKLEADCSDLRLRLSSTETALEHSRESLNEAVLERMQEYAHLQEEELAAKAALDVANLSVYDLKARFAKAESSCQLLESQQINQSKLEQVLRQQLEQNEAQLSDSTDQLGRLEGQLASAKSELATANVQVQQQTLEIAKAAQRTIELEGQLKSRTDEANLFRDKVAQKDGELQDIEQLLRQEKMHTEEDKIVQSGLEQEVRQLKASLLREQDAKDRGLLQLREQNAELHVSEEACKRVQEQIDRESEAQHALKDELSRVRASYESQLGQIKQQLADEKRSHQFDIERESEAQDQLRDSLAKARTTHELQMVELKQKLSEEIRSHQSDANRELDAQNRLKDELAEIRVSYEYQLDALKQKLATSDAQLSEIKQKLSEESRSHKSDVDRDFEVQSQLREELVSVREAYEAKLSQLNQKIMQEARSHQLELNDMKAQITRECEKQEQLANECKAEKAEVLELRACIAEERASRQQGLDQLGEQLAEECRLHKQSIKNFDMKQQELEQAAHSQRLQMQEQYQMELQALRESHVKAIEELRRQHESELSSLRETNRQLQYKLEKWQLEFRSEGEEQRMVHDQELQEMTASTERKLANLRKDHMQNLETQRINLESQIEELKRHYEEELAMQAKQNEERLLKKEELAREASRRYESQLTEMRERLQSQFLDNGVEVRRISEVYEAQLSEASVARQQQLKDLQGTQEEQQVTIRTLRKENEELHSQVKLLNDEILKARSAFDEEERELANFRMMYKASQHARGVSLAQVVTSTVLASAFATWQSNAFAAQWERSLSEDAQVRIGKAIMSWNATAELHCRSEESAFVILYFARWLSIVLLEVYQRVRWEEQSVREELNNSNQRLDEALANFAESEDKAARLASQESVLEKQSKELQEKVEVLAAAKAMGVAQLQSTRLGRRQHGLNTIDAESHLQILSAFASWRQQTVNCEAERLNDAVKRLETSASCHSDELNSVRRSRKDHFEMSTHLAMKVATYAAFTVWLQEKVKATSERIREHAWRSAAESAKELRLGRKAMALKALDANSAAFQRLSLSAWLQFVQLENRIAAETKVSSMRIRSCIIQDQIRIQVAHAFDSDCQVMLVAVLGSWREICIGVKAAQEVQDVKDRHGRHVDSLEAASNAQRSRFESEIETLREEIRDKEIMTSKELEEERMKARSAKLQLARLSDEMAQSHATMELAHSEAALLQEAVDNRNEEISYLSNDIGSLEKQMLSESKAAEAQLAGFRAQEAERERQGADLLAKEKLEIKHSMERLKLSLTEEKERLRAEFITEYGELEALYKEALAKQKDGFEQMHQDLKQKQADEATRRIEVEIGRWEQKAYDYRMECEDLRNDLLQNEAYFEERESEQACNQRQQLAQVEWVSKTEQSKLERQLEDLWSKYEAAKEAAKEEHNGLQKANAVLTEKEQEAMAKVLDAEQTAADHLAKYKTAKQSAAERMERCLHLEEDLTAAEEAHLDIMEELLAEKRSRQEDNEKSAGVKDQEILDLKNVLETRDKELNRLEKTMREWRQQQMAPLKDEVGRLRFEEARVMAERDRFQSECANMRSSNSPMGKGVESLSTTPQKTGSPYGDSYDGDDSLENGTTPPQGQIVASELSRDQIENARFEQSILQAKVLHLTSDLESSEQRNGKLHAELQLIQEELKHLKASTSSDPSDRDVFIDSLRKEITHLKVEREELGTSLDGTVEELQALKEKALNAELELRNMARAHTDKDVSEMSRQLQECIDERTALRVKINMYLTDRQSFVEQVARLTREQQTLQAENSKLQKQLESKKGGWFG
eukprot:gnl/MRDRNA2_/MRDRNA2_83562_c0_seq1.p1 gnl/MRDRNA2_/MRDRNA2_83562_c0~~gnl/MRDRNA2_/MRDRNA2_83562_c0_seq1.p1  ORF type:complete len:2375 (-),score=719.77 gnl/MRDRNA2_/MRDRNA2_83562_c0_seq1:10-6495(-)